MQLLLIVYLPHFDVYGPTLHNLKHFKKITVADITPIFTKYDATNAKSYRPVVFCPLHQKYKDFKEINQFSLLHEHISPFLCGVRK